MIVGTITLLTILFFGGVQQIFFIDKLEKGVKQYVLDKDRSKEIQSDLKESKAFIKAFNKDRSSKIKQFHTMNMDRDLHREDMLEFFEERVKERVLFQEEVLNQRIKVVAKIEPAEWKNIIALSDETVQKAEEKASKKEEKDAFAKVFDTIDKKIKENDRQVQVIALVQNFQMRYNDLGARVKSINTKESDLLVNKESSKEDFLSLAREVNELRNIAYQAFVDLHFDILDATTEEEWPAIMGAINKVIR